MTPLRQAVVLFFASGALFGAGLGLFIGHKTGIQSGLAMDSTARETLASEVESLSLRNQQQLVSLQTAESSISNLMRSMDEKQRAHEYDSRELELYRRIESAGLSKGIHVDNVQLIGSDEGGLIRITLLQVGVRNSVQGTLGVTLIGADLPGSHNGEMILAAKELGNGLAFDFRFMTRISMPLPADLAVAESSESSATWLEGLDLVEMDLIPDDQRLRPKRITIPAGNLIIGPGE